VNCQTPLIVDIDHPSKGFRAARNRATMADTLREAWQLGRVENRGVGGKRREFGRGGREAQAEPRSDERAAPPRISGPAIREIKPEVITKLFSTVI
jgi:hypothetical protein